MSLFLPVQCLACVHLHGPMIAATLDMPAHRVVRNCDAFPDGIPTEISGEGGDHRPAFTGDNGVQFKLDNTPSGREAFNNWQSVFGDKAS
jgi:hypothetical protein